MVQHGDGIAWFVIGATAKNHSDAHIVFAHVHYTDLLVATGVVLQQEINIGFRDVEGIGRRCASAMSRG